MIPRRFRSAGEFRANLRRILHVGSHRIVAPAGVDPHQGNQAEREFAGRHPDTQGNCVSSATRDFSLSNFERRVKRSCMSGLLMRRIDGCRRPTWRCADRVHIALVRFEAFQLPLVFHSVLMIVCPCTVLGLSRVS